MSVNKPPSIEMTQFSANFPVLLLDIEIGGPISEMAPISAETAQIYPRALALIRLHSHPLGQVEFNLGAEGLTAAEQMQIFWAHLEDEISNHLLQDGWHETKVASLNRDKAIPQLASPKCLRARQSLLANPPLASIIIATRDRPNRLRACLNSLFASDYPNYEIIVVDNAPATSSTREVVDAIQRESVSVQYVRESCPGLGVAHNCGLRQAKGTIVAFADDDVLVDRHWLSQLVLGFSASDNVACVTGMILPAELDTETQGFLEEFGRFNKGTTQRIFDLETNRLEHSLFPFSAGIFGSGANMAFQTAYLLECDGFDPALGAGTTARGGDDLAAFYEVIRNGYQLVYQPSAIVYHAHSQSYQRLRNQAFGFGVGLTAYLTKILIEQPGLIPRFLLMIPTGIYHVFISPSLNEAKTKPCFPQELLSLERKGMLVGPIAYILCRLKTKKLKRSLNVKI